MTTKKKKGWGGGGGPGRPGAVSSHCHGGGPGGLEGDLYTSVSPIHSVSPAMKPF